MSTELINQTLKRFEDAWNKHDAKAMSLLFAEDADFTNVFGTTYHGRAEVEQVHATLFSTFFQETDATFFETKVRFIKPDVAAVDATWGMTGAKDAQGNPWPNRKGLMNLIMTTERDNWVIAVFHNMDLPKVG